MKPTPLHYDAEALLLHLEDMLPPEERALAEEHFRGCDLCSLRLKELEAVISSLTTYRTTVFCPRPSELYKFAATGTDQGNKIADHVARCDSCSEDLSTFRDACSKRAIEMPPRIRQAFEDLCTPKITAAGFPDIRAALSKLREHSQWWPKLRGPGYAVALIIIVMAVGAYFYPREETRTMLGVSSVTWKRTDRLQLMGPAPAVEKPVVAIMLYIKDFKNPPDQNKIDAWYKAMDPDARLREWLDFVSPAEVKEVAAQAHDSRLVQRERSVQFMGNRVGASKALVLTITAQGERFEIQGDLTDVKTGKALGKAPSVELTDADLAAGLRHATFSLLERGRL